MAGVRIQTYTTSVDGHGVGSSTIDWNTLSPGRTRILYPRCMIRPPSVGNGR